MSSENIREIVGEKYGDATRRVSSGKGSACCGTSPTSAIDPCDPITSNLYAAGEAASVPESAMQASLVAAILHCLQNCNRAQPFWIWAQAERSMFYCLPAASARQEKRMAST